MENKSPCCYQRFYEKFRHFRDFLGICRDGRFDPRFCAQDGGVNSRPSLAGTADSSRNNSDEGSSAVDWTNEGPTRIALARILTAIGEAVRVKIRDASTDIVGHQGVDVTVHVLRNDSRKS